MSERVAPSQVQSPPLENPIAAADKGNRQFVSPLRRLSSRSLLMARRAVAVAPQILAITFLLYLSIVPLGVNLLSAFNAPADLLPLDPEGVFSLENFVAVYGNPNIAKITFDTLAFAFGSVCTGFLIGFSLAFLVERTDMPFKSLAYAAALMPLMMPTIVLVLAWMFLLGETNGLLNVGLRGILHLSGRGPLDIFTLYGMIIVQGCALTPLAFLFSSSALRNMAPSFEEAGSMSGAGFFTVVRRVTLPVLKPHLLSLIILMFIFSIETFEVPVLLGVGAQRQTFASEIYWSLNPTIGLPRFGEASATSITFLILAYALFFEFTRQTRNASKFATVTGKGFRPRCFSLRRWKAPALCFAGIFALLLCFFPLFVLVSASILNRFAIPFIPGSPKASLSAYHTIFADVRFLSAILNAVIVSAASAAIVSMTSATVGWLVARKVFPGRQALDLLASSSVTVPSVVVAFSFLVFHLTTSSWLPVYGTIWILILVYSYRMTVGYRINLAAIQQLSREIEEACEMSGATWFTAFRRVIVPLILPSFVTSFLLVFFLGFRDATLPLILGSRSTPLVTPMIWERIQIGELGVASAMSIVSLSIMALVAVVARRLIARTFA